MGSMTLFACLIHIPDLNMHLHNTLCCNTHNVVSVHDVVEI